MDVEPRATDSLTPYIRNARTHSDKHIKQIARSITEFGWTNPVLIDGDNGIIAGHGRVLAAKSLAMDTVPCIELRGMSELQKRAYIIADNQLALEAGWDTETLAFELGELKLGGFDLALTGFSEQALEGLGVTRSEGLADEDEAPEVPEVPVTITGDLWRLGSHRVLCGDATVATDVERVLDGVVPLLMVTDPPYGVEYDADWRNRVDRANGKPYGASAIGKVQNDERADWREAWALFPGEIIYAWHAGNKGRTAAEALEACGFDIRAQIIWAKPRFVIGRGHYHGQHEPCWYAVRKQGKGHWQGDRTQSTLWQIEHMKSDTGHSTQKPVECMRRPMINNSSQGQAVYDPFLGSGTSIIAAETTGRVCMGLEIHPPYCDVIVQRWQNFTGQEATLEDGQTFNERKAA